MPLLSLPNEILTPIILLVAEGVGIREAAEYRLVCTTFNIHILGHHIKVVARHNFNTIFEHATYKHIFNHHGGAILDRKFIRYTTLPKTFVIFMQKVVNHLLKRSDASNVTLNEVKEHYKFQVCNAMMAIEPKILHGYFTGIEKPKLISLSSLRSLAPALAATVGNINMLDDTISLEHLLLPHFELFPNALDAAVASNQTESIKAILGWMVLNVRDKTESGSWDEMRNAARVLTHALLVAVRLHRTHAGNMILDFFADNQVIDRSKGIGFMGHMIKHCIRHGNVPLLHRALAIYRTHESTAWDPTKPMIWKLSDHHIEDIFRIGHQRILRVFLQTGQLFPNHFDPYKQTGDEIGMSLLERTPLAYAMEKRRHDLAELLLANGADINGFPKHGYPETALYRAAKFAYYRDVQFLLCHGAEPDYPKDQENSPMHVVKKQSLYNSKTKFLLKMAKEEGNEAVMRGDIWDRYD